MREGIVSVSVASTCLALGLVAAPAVGGSVPSWPAFRGADALAVAADDPRLPESWSTTENVVWVREIPGLGWSSPVVWGDRVFLTSVVGEGEVEEPRKGLYMGGNRPAPPTTMHHWMVYCVDAASGELCWEKEVHSGVPSFARHLKNTFASETPVTDGERVYAYFGNLGVFALDLEGNVVWESRFAPMATRFGWGTAASPQLHGGRLYIVNDNEEQSYLVALDKESGEELWRQPREEGSNWATPFVWENDLRTEIVTAGTDMVRSYDEDGNLLWYFRGMSSIAIPQPFAEHGLLYVASGYVGDSNRPVFAVRPGAAGDITLAEGATSSEFVAWYQPQAGPYNPTPLVYGEQFYTLLDAGFFTSHHALTGEEIYGKQRIERGAGAFTASPWAYNGKIFVLSEDGDTFVIRAGKEFEVVGKSSLDEMCMASPAIAAGSLYIRTRTKLYRLSAAMQSSLPADVAPAGSAGEEGR